MSSLIRSYGKGLTAIFVTLTAFWLLLLIILPQAFMLDQSLWSIDKDDQLGMKIDRAYSDLGLLEYDVQQATGDTKPPFRKKSIH